LREEQNYMNILNYIYSIYVDAIKLKGHQVACFRSDTKSYTLLSIIKLAGL